MKPFILAAALTLFLSPGISYARRLDPEVNESAKCAKYFRYFEKKYNIPSDTLHSISLHESGKHHSEKKMKMVWPWTANVEGKGYHFDNKQEAINFIGQQYMLGKSIDVGCMQINLRYHPDAFKTVGHALNPKHNVGYAAKFLREKYNQTGDWHKAIALYHSATPHLGGKYHASVLKIANNIDSFKTIYKRDKSQPANTKYWNARNRKAYKISAKGS